MYNGCIFMISERKNILKTCLEYLDLNYNKLFNYPILIFYHGNKYDNLNFQKSIQIINTNTKVSFHKIEANVPEHILEKDLFYNLKGNDYVKNCFTKERLGYLHANYFWNNFMNYSELNKYDYLIRIDDDSYFKNKINFDVFEELDKNNKLCGTGYTWNNVSHRVLDTRVNFYKWIQEYCIKYKIRIKNENLEKYLKEGENDIVNKRKCNKNFHTMNYLSGNFNIYNRKMFEGNDWKNFLDEFNKIAGGYRYRWGDCEIISMFYYIYIDSEFLDLKLKEKGLYDNQLLNFGGMVKDLDL